MSSKVTTRRKNAFNAFREASKLASFDEFPILRPEVDPQLHLSRNEVDQPFHLVCEKDTVIVQLGGKARVEFNEGAIRHFDLAPGDYVYVPGGMPHRIRTRETGEQMRYKAQAPGTEAVVWYCEDCGSELDRMVWQATSTAPQAGYQAASERHNADPIRRTCVDCGKVHSPIDLSPFRWAAVAEALTRLEEDA